MKSINWQSLRPWNGSQNSAFEELCCQLARYEQAPSGSTFIRKGAPDAGVECFLKLPNGDEWGWQAKFFLSPPDVNQWRQVNDSIVTALGKHPQLTSITICFPIDRHDPRIKNQKWFMDKWNGVEGHFFDNQGNLIAFDPSIRSPGPAALLMNRDVFLKFLNDNGYDILWTILGEKNIMGGGLSSHDNWKGRLEFSGAYKIHENKVQGEINSKFVHLG